MKRGLTPTEYAEAMYVADQASGRIMGQRATETARAALHSWLHQLSPPEWVWEIDAPYEQSSFWVDDDGAPISIMSGNWNVAVKSIEGEEVAMFVQPQVTHIEVTFKVSTQE